MYSDLTFFFFLATSSSLVNTCTTCQPVPQFDSPSLTIGYFSVVEGNSTTCQNKEPLPDLKQCSGHCESRATYTAVMQGFDSNCQCCQPSRTVTRTAVLTCSDGSTRSRSYSVPEACGCSACSGTTWPWTFIMASFSYTFYITVKHLYFLTSYTLLFEYFPLLCIVVFMYSCAFIK